MYFFFFSSRISQSKEARVRAKEEIKRRPGNIFELPRVSWNGVNWQRVYYRGKMGGGGAKHEAPMYMRIEDFSADHNITIKPPVRCGYA